MYGTEDGSKLASTKVSEADVAGCVSEKEKTAKMVEVAAQKICEELGELRFSWSQDSHIKKHQEILKEKYSTDWILKIA